jgi:hypothetical protein
MNIITLLFMTLLVVATVSVSYMSYKYEGIKTARTYCVFMAVVGWFAVVTTLSEMVL